MVRMSIRRKIILVLLTTAIACIFGLGHSEARAEIAQKTGRASAETPAGKPQTFKCEGSFGPDASHAKLAKEFGAANIDTDYDSEAEGEVTILFPKDPQRRLIIQWRNPEARRKPASIRIEGSLWSAAGVTIGTSLAELERLNGGPFAVTFDVDDPGNISDWKGGRLKTPFSHGCRFGAGVWIDYDLSEAVDKATSEVSNEGSGDGSLLSSSPELRAAKPAVVNRMSIAYPK